MPTFTPRSFTERMVPTHTKPVDTLWSRMSVNRTYALLKTGSSYREVLNPSNEEVAAADIAYLGGHIYTVTTQEAAALNAAGYTTA